jgi:hypothetical protein
VLFSLLATICIQISGWQREEIRFVIAKGFTTICPCVIGGWQVHEMELIGFGQVEAGRHDVIITCHAE